MINKKKLVKSKGKWIVASSMALAIGLVPTLAHAEEASVAETPVADTVTDSDDLTAEEMGALPVVSSGVTDGTVALPDTFTATKPADQAVIDQAATSPEVLTKEYVVFPTPQNYAYGDQAVKLEGRLNLVVGQGIDIYTSNRLKEILQSNQISYDTSETTVANKLNVYLGIHGTNSAAETHQAGLVKTDKLYDKIDAYSLAVKQNGISVVGKDTDSVFYGLTTLKHLLKDTTAPVLREVVVEDFANMKNRGFIEGYYGNPWSNEDRKALMEYGGDLKMTQYFFAPKDDPYHNSRWRELYPEEKLNDIRELARTGNQTKTRYVWTLHPFMHDAIRFDDANYANDLGAVKAKFTQLLDAGVREFGILADDARTPAGGMASYNRLMADLTTWLESQQSKYTGLRKEMIFVPSEYWGNGNEAQLKGLNKGLPESSSLVLTGGRIWGEASSNFLETYKRNVTNNGQDTYRPVHLWINWPCTDNSKQHLILGGGEKFLHPGIDPTLLSGIMLNPMQQSEPSKIALFQAADYTWKVWKTEADAHRANEKAFDFAENGTFRSSETSSAFRELGKHMINQNMDTRVVKLEESIELAPKLQQFLTKLKAGQSTDVEREALRSEFKKLKDAALTYKASGNAAMKEQIHYWLDNTVDQMTALDELLTATQYIGQNQPDKLWQHYAAGLANYEKSKTYTFHYVDHYERAELGVQHIRPFIQQTLAKVAQELERELDPTALTTRFITNRADVPESVEAVFDQDTTTQIVFKSPNRIAKGDYVGVEFSRVTDISSVSFAMGATSNLNDTFTKAVLEYKNEAGEWVPVPSASIVGNEQVVHVDQLNLKAQGLRLISTSEKENTWLGLREIAINKALPTPKAQGTLSLSPNLKYRYNTNDTQALDGKDNTETMVANANNQDNAPADAWVQLDLGSVRNLSEVRILQGSGDKIERGVVEVSTDGQQWQSIHQVQGERLITVKTPVTARYVRIKNAEQINKWWRIADFSVKEGDMTTADYTDTNRSELAATTVRAQLGHYTQNLPETLTLAAGEYIGLKLDRIRELKQIDATVGDSGLVVEYSPNLVEWTRGTQVKPGDLARYVRVVNPTTQAITVNQPRLSVSTKEIIPPSLKETTMGIHQVYGASDVRNLNNLGDLFDGKLDRFVEFSDIPRQDGHITLNLGTTRQVKKIRAYVQDGTQNYLRDGKIQVSADGTQWVDVVTVGDGVANARRDDSLTDGWTHDSSNPGNRYIEGALATPIEANYLRVVFTADYQHRFVGFTELVINDGEYVKRELFAPVTTKDAEQANHETSLLVDGKLLTSYKPTGDKGEVTYHLSEKTNANRIRLISKLPEGATAAVYARVSNANGSESGWTGLGSIEKDFSTFGIEASDKQLLDVKIVWAGGAPEFYELSTYYDTTPLPKVEDPKVEDPKVENPKVEDPKVEDPKVEDPKVEDPKVEDPKVEDPKVEDPKVEDPKVEDPKVEDPKVEDPKVENPKVEDPKVEDPKVEDPKQDNPKAVVKVPSVSPQTIDKPVYDLQGDNDKDGYNNFTELVLGSDPEKRDSVPQPKVLPDKQHEGTTNSKTDQSVDKVTEMAVGNIQTSPAESVLATVATGTAKSAVLPETGEEAATLIFGAAALAILASVGLMVPRKENSN